MHALGPSFRRARWLVPLALVLTAGVSSASVDPTGQLAEEVRVEVPAFHRITPAVALRYSSGGSNGFVGVGWTLDSGSKITRISAARGIARGEATDSYLLDGVELVPCTATTASTSPSCSTARTAFESDTMFFSTKIENYQRIRRDVDPDGWTVWGRDGTRRTYATTDSGMTYELTAVSDLRGNTVRYKSWCDGANNCYPDSIKYADAGGLPGAEIRFVREPRPDKLSRARGGGTAGYILYRLRAVVVRMDGKPLRAYQLAYRQSQSTGASIVSSIEQFGNDAVVNANGVYTSGPTPSLPALRLTTPSMQGAGSAETRLITDSGVTALNLTSPAYPDRFGGGAESQVTYRVGSYQNDGDGDWVERPHGQAVGDFDGNGRADWLAWSISNNSCTEFETQTVRMTKTGSQAVVTSTVVAGPGPQTSHPKAERCQPSIHVMDLNGDRRDDLLMVAGNQLTQIIATGDGNFMTRSTQTWTSNAEHCTTTDLDGDGRDDLACTGTETGAVVLTIARSLADGSWQLSSDPLTGLGVTENVHGITAGDFNGDGLGDLTIATQIGSQWTLLAGASDGDGKLTWTTQATAWPSAPGAYPRLNTTDIDGDGKTDVVLDHQYIGFAAKGATARYRLGMIASPSGLTQGFDLGDCNGDGRTDLMIGQGCARGRGDGGFDPPGAGGSLPACDLTAHPNGDQATIHIDLNGDGRIDTLCTSDEFPTYTLFDHMTPAIADPRNWMQGDITGDGAAEILHISHLAPGYLITSVSTLDQSKTNFTWSPMRGIADLDEPDVSRFIVADVGSMSGAPDGKADLVLVDIKTSRPYAGSLRVYTLLSNGDGTFTPRMNSPWGTAPYASRDLQQWRSAELDGDGRGDLVHTVATESGVVVESLRSNGDGTWIGARRPYFPGIGSLAGNDFMAIDVSGDGLTDLVHAEGNATMNTSILRTLLGNGDGTFSERTSPYGTSFRDMRRVKVADVDGDGLADLVHVARGGTANASRIDLQFYLSDGNGGWRFLLHSVDWTSAEPEDASLLEDANFARFMDVDGDGRADLVHLSTYIDAAGWPATAMLVAHNPGADALHAWPRQLTKNLQFWAFTADYDHDPWRWQSWRDPLTGDPALIYVHPTRSRAFYFHPARDQVTRVDNSAGGITNVTYTPLLGRRTYLPEGSLPTVVSALEIRDEAVSPAISELVEYAYGEARYSIPIGRMGFGWRTVRDHSSTKLTKDTVDDLCGVRSTQVQHQSVTASIYSYSDYTYVNPTATGKAPYTCDRYIDDSYECQGTGSCRLAQRQVLVLDAYGNAVSAQVTTDQAAESLIYRPTTPVNATDYIVDKPAYEVHYGDSGAGWAGLSVTTFGYDGRGFGEGPGAFGEQTALERYDGTAGVYRHTAFGYTATGQLESTVDPRNQTTTVTYDPRYGLYPSRLCNGTICTNVVVDPTSGLTTDSYDDNHAHTEMHYDAHGRLLSTKRPNGGTTTTTFLNTGVITGPASQRQRVRIETTDTSADHVLWTETFYDGLGRTYRTTREGGATVDTRYNDASKRPQSSSNTYLTGASTLAWTTFEYDPAGRLIRTSAPDNTERLTTFEVGKTIGTDQNGHAKTAYTDGKGHVIRIDEPKGTMTISTHYTLDALGRLRSTTDQLGNITSVEYDMLGRQLRVSDPDRGVHEFTYFSNDLLETVTDAKGQVIRYDYDSMGRRTVREDLDTSGAAVRTARWLWDRDAAGNVLGASLGRVVTMTDAQASTQLSESYSYDLEGHATETTRCIDGTCLGTRATYDAAGRLDALTYPDAAGSFGGGSETVNYRYDDAGMLLSVGNHVTAISYELDGRQASMTYGNGVTTATIYDESRRWVDSETVTSPVQGQIYAASYAHDPAGRIKHLNEQNPTRTVLTYTFDELGQLKEVDASDASRREEFSYDAIGRMSFSGRTGHVLYTDPLHVHAPTEATLGWSRKYDELGNLTDMVNPSGGIADLKWNIDGTLASTKVTSGGGVTKYAYDPSGMRVKKSSAAGDTLQFGPYMELAQGRFIKYYRAGDRLISRADGAQRAYYTQDLTRSTRVVTDAAGRVTNRYDYTAFGRVLTSSEYIPQDQEHGDGRHDDETNLTYMNARYYDPELMHFISADSIVPSVHDPQSFHRYSYAQQDPINFWDPSGHMRASVERRKELQQESSLQWMYNRSGTLCGSNSVCWSIPIEMLHDIRDNARWALWSAANVKRRDVAQERIRADEAASAVVPFVEIAMHVTKTASEKIESEETSEPFSFLTCSWFSGLYDEVSALDHDMFIFGGLESEAKFPIKGVHVGETLENMVLLGHGSEPGFYVEGIHAIGASVEVGLARLKAYAGMFGAMSVPIWSSKPVSSVGTGGILVEGGLGIAYAGAFDFGGHHKGFYAGVRIGHYFVGGGMTYESLAYQTRAANLIILRTYQAWKKSNP